MTACRDQSKPPRARPRADAASVASHTALVSCDPKCPAPARSVGAASAPSSMPAPGGVWRGRAPRHVRERRRERPFYGKTTAIQYAAAPVFPAPPLPHPAVIPALARTPPLARYGTCAPPLCLPARQTHPPLPANALKRSRLGRPPRPLRRAATPWPPRPQTRRPKRAPSPASSFPPAPRPWRAGPGPFCSAPA